MPPEDRSSGETVPEPDLAPAPSELEVELLVLDILSKRGCARVSDIKRMLDSKGYLVGLDRIRRVLRSSPRVVRLLNGTYCYGGQKRTGEKKE